MKHILLRIVSLAILVSFPATDRAADDEARAIIVKAIQAHGGEQTLTKLKAGQSRTKGKITIPNFGEVDFTQETAYLLPDKLRESMNLTVGGQKVYVLTILDGDKLSIDANDKAVEVTDNIKKAFEDVKYLMKVARLVTLLKDKSYELSAAGEIKVEDKPAVGVRVASKGNKDISLYFDKQTGLLAKLEHRTIDSQTGVEIGEERIILEYQKPSEAPALPKKILIRHDGKTYIEAEVIEGKLLETLDDGLFRK